MYKQFEINTRISDELKGRIRTRERGKSGGGSRPLTAAAVGADRRLTRCVFASTRPTRSAPTTTRPTSLLVFIIFPTQGGGAPDSSGPRNMNLQSEAMVEDQLRRSSGLSTEGLGGGGGEEEGDIIWMIQT